MTLSEHNKKILKHFVHIDLYSDQNIYKQLLDEPNTAILYMKHKQHHIRYVARYIIEDRDICEYPDK